ncbi:MAG: hypothetical protein KatS3mg001_468 [Candidatus Pacearchaeota archaeon]|nr:MAG: hypothetical protein KatS3mg001_468 [Candidatus Pacearchaeota archaeon]
MPQKEKIDRVSVAYILGILSIVFAFISPLAGIIIAIIGIVQSNKGDAKKVRNLNIIGLVLSIIIFVLSLFLVFSNLTNVVPSI